jgi:hypothetical protein
MTLILDRLEHILTSKTVDELDLVEETLHAGLRGEVLQELVLTPYGQRVRTWYRFAAMYKRIYGPGWKEVVSARLHAGHLEYCSRHAKRGCMELALGGLCDQCILQQGYV